MRVGILGSGAVGQALGTGLTTLSHDVKIGSREPSKLDEWVAQGGQHASAGTFEQAAAFGEIVALATLWAGTQQALELAGKRNLAGKVVIDVTNPPDFSQGRPGLALGHTDSGGEQVQRWLPDSKVVKAFNSVGNPYMFRPDFPGGPADMFMCGNDDGAKETVAQICRDFGWNPLDVGGIEGARLLEPLCILWVTVVQRTGVHAQGFKLLKK
ncbi:MAG TPA: NAD(P)-binding domain-containing protein [Chloroflexota bacterium]|nr:NAD(P)-binding domain-containing protein [Chloroflexota bacterium]